MNIHKTFELKKELFNRIKLVRRDIGDLLFHFTRAPKQENVVIYNSNSTRYMNASAYSVLNKILYEGQLCGTSKWTYGEKCICFTEAPITEFNSIFSLIEIASSEHERPRYEPYGVAVSKEWLFKHGGRPVIYDHPDTFDSYPDFLKYRFVPYDLEKGIDYSWEREWRIKIDMLQLDPKYTLAIVLTAEEAFDIVYEFAKEEAEWDVEGSSGEGYICGSYHEPRWLAVSLDLFGFKHN